MDGSRIIIAEKADAGRRIAYFLSGGNVKSHRSKGTSYLEFEYDGAKTYLIPLSGHIVEADFESGYSDWSKIDLSDLIDAKIVKNVKNRIAYQTLTSFRGKVHEIVIATDYDREGELIGVEALDIIRNGDESVKRAKFSALTRNEIMDSFKNLIGVNYSLADAADARESIDLIWGSVLTRFFSVTTGRLGRSFLSAGRVQTPTLAIIVDREREIISFRPEPYWTLHVVFDKDGKFVARYPENIKDRNTAENIFNSINGKNGRVVSYRSRDESIRRPAPFSTTEFLREASRIGIMPSKAMSIAENLYMRGLISYPRTDNTVYPRSINLKAVLKKLENTSYSKYVKEIESFDRILPSRGRTETTDHPPIYPVDAPKEDLKGDYARVYDLVLKHFLSTLYRDGSKTVTEAEIDIAGHIFLANGQRTTDRGWTQIYGYEPRDVYLPQLVEGEEVKAVDWKMEEDETKPPPRYDMSALLKKMEDLNLGTKSTRHDIIGKLIERGFIEGNPVRPTPLGMAFIDAVRSVNSHIADPEMTAKLEQDMDRIERNEMRKAEVVEESKRMLHEVLSHFMNRTESVREIITKGLNSGQDIGNCPFHEGKKIMLMKDRFTYTIRCEDQSCRINFKIKRNGSISLSDEKCPVCGLPMIRIIRKGQSPEIKCIDPDCTFNRENDDYGECPSDHGRLVLRQSKYGKRFLGCSNYPKCTVTYPLPQMGKIIKTGETCQYCGAPILAVSRGGRRWKFCPNMSCEYNKKRKTSEGTDKKERRTRKNASKS
ncbi:DNA topoisomerase I [Thermoplasma sp. Kam2015]|uniref:DNA topoisomerase I n=1 Tax=Thermoplasma sp. Kam2015 TaxID=2094122 RepID=UPI000D94D785|nr:DNA topoisomerase I [Thermoplasma sp. Kam2015]PYB69125.1 DNA topoisomerase I [Thermoplasma sp. Kam2015]